MQNLKPFSQKGTKKYYPPPGVMDEGLFVSISVRKLIEEMAHEYTHNSSQGGMLSMTPYDTAWLAMVPDRDRPSEALAFPKAFDWVMQHQSSDGSWSGELVEDSYKIIPTLACLLALLKAPKPYQTEKRVRKAIISAQTFLDRTLRGWVITQHESVGFEILVISLLQEIELLGIRFEFSCKTELVALYNKKLGLAKLENIYSGKSNLIHSIEAFGKNLDFNRLKMQQAVNGSYGCSPAATAAVLIYGQERDKKAENWLNFLIEHGQGDEIGAVPNVYPIDVFEAAWVLHNLIQKPSLARLLKSSEATQILLKHLTDSITENGVSITHDAGLPTDSDDTGMLLATLNLAGQKISTESLDRFELEKHFACFVDERGASLSANAHVLAALTSLPYSQRCEKKILNQIKKVVAYLLETRQPDGFWLDKWHLSSYYATSCVLLALQYYPDIFSISTRKNMSLAILKWLTETQSQEDGGWGSSTSIESVNRNSFSSLEETAYALQIIQTLPKMYSNLTIDSALVERGRLYLLNRLHTNQPDLYTAKARLWRGKDLYLPNRVVLSALLGALAN